MAFSFYTIIRKQLSRNLYLRQALIRRRTASDSAVSSGQHSAHGRKTNTEEPNSVEKGTHRRKAPAPVRVCFAGAGAIAKFVSPTSPRSPEDILCPHTQLRPAFACRRKTDTEEPNSVERGAHRRKAPAPVRVCFAGAGAIAKFVSPTSPHSPEDSICPRTQLRPTFSRRRKTNTEEPNSVEKGAHRRKAPAPVRVCFAGAGARWEYVPPTSPRSPEDSICPHTQLRPAAGNRRTADHRNPTSDESTLRRRNRHRRATTESLCKKFSILPTHFPLHFIPTGVLLTPYNRNLKTL